MYDGMATHVVPLELRNLPHEFLCPITLAVMRHPTRVRPASRDDDADSVAPPRSPRPSTFEYRAIAQWRAHCRRTGRPFCDPLTNLGLDAHLEPDRKHGRGFLEATRRVVTATRARTP